MTPELQVGTPSLSPIRKENKWNVQTRIHINMPK